VSSPLVEELRTLLDPAPQRFATLETPRGLSVLRWIIGVVVVFGLLGCVTKGANSPADPYLSSPGPPATSATNASGRSPLQGFGETQITVQSGDQLLTWCLLLAATDAQRQRGLMTVTDTNLGGYDGMLFRYDADVQERYWMRNTPMPLSIAWINADGLLVATADMAPCEDSDQCQSYPVAGPPPPYRYAIEVPQGRLASLGLDETATMTDQATACT
jgi:uncharacterized membrane protein (UPF0127 family)